VIMLKYMILIGAKHTEYSLLQSGEYEVYGYSEKDAIEVPVMEFTKQKLEQQSLQEEQDMVAQIYTLVTELHTSVELVAKVAKIDYDCEKDKSCLR